MRIEPWRAITVSVTIFAVSVIGGGAVVSLSQPAAKRNAASPMMIWLPRTRVDPGITLAPLGDENAPLALAIDVPRVTESTYWRSSHRDPREASRHRAK